MIDFCTVSDYNYLAKGLSLFESLRKHANDFTFHYLCLDKQSYEKVRSLKIDNLKAYDVEMLLSKDQTLQKLRGENYKYFCWTFSSYFTEYILQNTNSDAACYVDSDIFFHNSFKEIQDAIGDSDVGIFRHRHFPLDSKVPEGRFNVGVVYFKNSPKGKEVLEWWKDAVLHKKHKEYHGCGDQKYLNAFPGMCEKGEIFIDGNIGHGAPWQWQLYNYKQFFETGKIIWNGNAQNLVFSHFSEFKYDLNNDTFIHSAGHQPLTNKGAIFEIPQIDAIHKEYFEMIKQVEHKYLQ